MAVGRELGTFDMKSTSVTLVPGKGDFLTLHINYEGSATGEIECEAIATMTVESADGKDGKYSISARCFMTDGRIPDATGQGKTVLESDHIWTVAGITEVAGWRGWAIQGKINLGDRSFVGKMLERT